MYSDNQFQPWRTEGRAQPLAVFAPGHTFYSTSTISKVTKVVSTSVLLKSVESLPVPLVSPEQQTRSKASSSGTDTCQETPACSVQSSAGSENQCRSGCALSSAEKL